MVLQADESVTRSQLNASPDTLSRSFLQNPHTTIDTFSTQVAIIDHTITNINKRLQSLEGNTYSHNTAISNYDTSRTRKSRKNSTSALIDYTDLDHSSPYIRPQQTRHDTSDRVTHTRSRSDSPQYRSPHSGSLPHIHPPPMTTSSPASRSTKFYYGLNQHSRHTRNHPIDTDHGYSKCRLP